MVVLLQHATYTLPCSFLKACCRKITCRKKTNLEVANGLPFEALLCSPAKKACKMFLFSFWQEVVLTLQQVKFCISLWKLGITYFVKNSLLIVSYVMEMLKRKKWVNKSLSHKRLELVTIEHMLQCSPNWPIKPDTKII